MVKQWRVNACKWVIKTRILLIPWHILFGFWLCFCDSSEVKISIKMASYFFKLFQQSKLILLSITRQYSKNIFNFPIPSVKCRCQIWPWLNQFAWKMSSIIFTDFSVALTRSPSPSCLIFPRFSLGRLAGLARWKWPLIAPLLRDTLLCPISTHILFTRIRWFHVSLDHF